MSRRGRYSRRRYRGGRDLGVSWERLEYLRCRSLPRCLYGVSLREIIGSVAYKREKVRAKASCGSNCSICGRLVSKDFKSKDFIYCTEAYRVSFDKKVIYLDGLIGVCRECFLFMNPWLLRREVEELGITPSRARLIEDRGYNLLVPYGYGVHSIAPKSVFVMQYGGYRYINDSLPWLLDRAIGAGVRVIHWEGVVRSLLPELYHYVP